MPDVPADTFSVSRGDFLAFRKQAALQLRKRRPGWPWLFALYVSAWMFAGAAVSSFLRVYDRGGPLRPALLVVAGLTVSAVLVFVLFRVAAGKVTEKYLLRDSGGFLASQTLACEEDGMRLTTQTTGSSVWLPWSAFMGRAEDGKNLYLFTAPSYGVILPEAALSDDRIALLRTRVHAL